LTNIFYYYFLDKPYIQYQASSPDEYALVKTAADLGFAFQVFLSFSFFSLGCVS